MLGRKKVLKYIAIIIVVKIVFFSLFLLYSVNNVEKSPSIKKLKINDVAVISAPKQKLKTAQEIEQEKNERIKWQLKREIEPLFDSAQEIYTLNKTKQKSKIIEALKIHLEKETKENIFIANFKEETLYGSNSYKDINARTISLEEIQKVRRRDSGLIVSTIDVKPTKRYVYVRNLHFLDLYIGINLIQ